MTILPDVENVIRIDEPEVIQIESTDDETDHPTEVLANESNHSEDDPEIKNLEEEFAADEDVEIHSWAMKVTATMANLRKKQVLHLPNEFSRNVIGNIEHIRLMSEDTEFFYDCNIISSARTTDVGCYEKHIGDGWYQFMQRHRPSVGDTLLFTLVEPPPLELNVKIERWNTRHYN
ncbi:B3 DNA-binding domain protein [Trifolium medium]|uniref:B3 DNA-binding domain protein n=1 Tax=Trifolium medium TaxID=97028 RepID=A0A392M7P7_9FABA|nr:B3 DNA-binding domain protein [Trifolium medium]